MAALMALPNQTKLVPRPKRRRRGNDTGLEHDAETARDDDGRGERGNEDADDIGAVARRFLGDFRIHARSLGLKAAL